jgi:hypothetical protein
LTICSPQEKVIHCFVLLLIYIFYLDLSHLLPWVLSLGAGFAGGIVSAAVDGLAVAEGIKSKFLGASGASSDGKTFSVGFEY